MTPKACVETLANEATEMARNVSTVFLVVGLLFFASACGNPEGRQQSRETRRLKQINQAIAQGYDTLNRQYEAMAEQMPPDVQQMYGNLQRMHTQTMHLDQQMLSGRVAEGEEHGMMRPGMHTAALAPLLREWHRQMLSMHDAMARMHHNTGRDSLLAGHQKMAQRHWQMLEILSENIDSAKAPPAPKGELLDAGSLYAQHCSSCHGADGTGMGSVLPPLAASTWVTGDASVPIRVVLHGLQGPIEVDGRAYHGMMPAFERRLSDMEVAAILSYVRSSWANKAPGVAARDVASVRVAHRGRKQPWVASELDIAQGH